MGLTSRSAPVVVAAVYDLGAAQSLAALLNAELVPAEIAPGSRVIGETRVSEVRVPSTSSERARLLLAPSLLSEAEFNYLATGVLAGNDVPIDRSANSSNNRLERSRGRSFGGPGRESMIGMNQLRWSLANGYINFVGRRRIVVPLGVVDRGLM
jgi:hypothetical protein